MAFRVSLLMAWHYCPRCLQFYSIVSLRLVNHSLLSIKTYVEIRKKLDNLLSYTEDESLEIRMHLQDVLQNKVKI